MKKEELERFAELEAKGAENLNEAEKAEYETLDKKQKGDVSDKSAEPDDEPEDAEESTPPDNSQDTPEEPKGDVDGPSDQEETVTLKKSDLMGMIREAVNEQTSELKKSQESLEKQLGLGGWTEYKGPETQNKQATIKKYREHTDAPWEIIIDWKHLRWDFDELTRRHDKDIYKLTLWNEEEGKEREIEMPISQFAKLNDIEIVEILEKIEKPLVKNHGVVRVSTTDKHGYTRPNEKGEYEIGLDERMSVFTCKVQRHNGKIMTIPENRLNG